MTNNALGGVMAHPSTATGLTQVYVTDSEVSGRTASGAVGLYSWGAVPGAVAKIFANRVSISNVLDGLIVTATGTSSIEIGNSMVVRNGANFSQSAPGVIRSLGNNHISDATGSDVGALTPLAPR